MAKFHVNPKTGDAGECTSTKGKCPFGEESAHFTSADAARKNFEETTSLEREADKIVELSLKERGGREGGVFKSWSKIHPDFKTSTDGIRSVLTMTNKGTSLVPWLGPKVLEAYDARRFDRFANMERTPNMAGYHMTINPMDLDKTKVGDRFYDLEGSAYIVESTGSKVTMNPLDEEGKPLGTAGKGVIPVGLTEGNSPEKFFKLVKLEI